jgi:bla regulator protein BlaR1
MVSASASIDLSAPVGVRSSPAIMEPGVVGLVRPILLLPEGITERLTPSELEAVPAHELCHVRRRDNLFASIHMLVEAVFWFHPLVWWIGARLVEKRERACDEQVLNLGRRPDVYAGATLNICKLYVESRLSGHPEPEIRLR